MYSVVRDALQAVTSRDTSGGGRRNERRKEGRKLVKLVS